MLIQETEIGINFCSWRGSCLQTCHEGAAQYLNYHMEKIIEYKILLFQKLTEVAGDWDLDGDLQNVSKTKKLLLNNAALILFDPSMFNTHTHESNK